MKKFAIALLMVLICSTCAFAAVAKRGQIPGCDYVKYSALKVANSGVTIVLHNKGEKTVELQAALAFLNHKREEVGDCYFDNVVIEPKGEVVFREVYLKGDPVACRKAESLRWTIYKLEEK